MAYGTNGARGRAHSARYLDDGEMPETDIVTNADVSRFLLAASLEDLGGEPVLGPSADGDDLVASLMADETVAAAERSGGASAAHWYTDSIAKALGIAGMMHPELLDDDAARALPNAGFRNSAEARTVLCAALAVTSQNIAIESNARFGLEQYRAFVGTGRFEPRTYGAKGAAIKGNLARFNLLLDLCDGDLGRLGDFLAAEFTMEELRGVAAAHGIKLGGQELNDEIVYGSMVFGPKIGNGYFQNLIGNHRPITIDLWFMRSWGRWTGTLMRDDVSPAQLDRLVSTLKVGKRMRDGMADAGVSFDRRSIRGMERDDLLSLCQRLHLFWERSRKSLARAGWDNARLSEHKAAMGWPGAAEAIVKTVGASVDQPGNAGKRRWIRKVAALALEKLDTRGYPMTAADMQALLWYPEKALYDTIAGRPVGGLNMSYDQAFAGIARREGFDERSIDDACAAALRDGPRGRGVHAGAGRGAARGAEGLPEGPPVSVVEAAEAFGRGRGLTAPDEDEALPMAMAG